MIEVVVEDKRFGGVQVLGQVAFTVAPGEVLAILGPSGAGKSTLLRIVAGVDEDYTGHVCGPARRAMVFQDPTLLPWRSALDNLRIVHPGLGADEAQTMLDKVGLGDRGAAFPGQLSLGQQRRLSLARAFAGRPELLIMDEPFVSLDAATGNHRGWLCDAVPEKAPGSRWQQAARREMEELTRARLHDLCGASWMLGSNSSWAWKACMSLFCV